MTFTAVLISNMTTSHRISIVTKYISGIYNKVVKFNVLSSAVEKLTWTTSDTLL